LDIRSTFERVFGRL